MTRSQTRWEWIKFTSDALAGRLDDDEGLLTRPDAVPLELDGQSGNAFAVLVLCREAALAGGWSMFQWDRFFWDATAGDHDQLMAVVRAWFEVR